MIQILNLSYNDLPRHLKTCLLYLGMYPEDHEIPRDDLVRRWIAEGFVSTQHGRDLVDVGESYFNELVNRSLIQPKHTSYNGEVWTCGVHDMMFNLILRRCAEDNFVSVVYDPQFMPGQVRCLSMNLVDAEDGTTVPATITNLSQLRSLAIFRKSACIPPLLDFKFLRVLEFDFSVVVEKDNRLDLIGITKLFQLKYLKISAKSYRYKSSIQLPSQIRGLQQLETLYICWEGDVSLSTDIVDLPRLLHLTLSLLDGIRLPNRIGNMESLQTLEGFDLKESSLDNIKALGELTKLRKLHLRSDGRSFAADEATTRRMDALRSSVEKLRNLRLLYVLGRHDINADGLSSLSPPPHHLVRLQLRALIFSKFPRWVDHLHNLDTLWLTVREVREDDVHVLGDLPSLTGLWLHIPQAPIERIVISGSAMRFPALKGFLFECGWMSYLTFTVGAMPNLQTLSLRISKKWDHGTPVGMEHLLSLKEIMLGTPSEDGTVPQNTAQSEEAAESAFRNAAQVHPSSPAFTKYHYAVDL